MGQQTTNVSLGMEIMVVHLEQETHFWTSFGCLGGNNVPSASFSMIVPEESVCTVLPSANFSMRTPSNEVCTLLPSFQVSMTVPLGFLCVAWPLGRRTIRVWSGMVFFLKKISKCFVVHVKHVKKGEKQKFNEKDVPRSHKREPSIHKSRRNESLYCMVTN